MLGETPPQKKTISTSSNDFAHLEVVGIEYLWIPTIAITFTRTKYIINLFIAWLEQISQTLLTWEFYVFCSYQWPFQPQKLGAYSYDRTWKQLIAINWPRPASNWKPSVRCLAWTWCVAGDGWGGGMKIREMARKPLKNMGWRMSVKLIFWGKVQKTSSGSAFSFRKCWFPQNVCPASRELVRVGWKAPIWSARHPKKSQESCVCLECIFHDGPRTCSKGVFQRF